MDAPLPVAEDESVHAPASRGAAVLGYLLGEWELERLLEDHSLGLRGAFWGMARFIADGAGAGYHERGRLRWPTYDGPATRSLRYDVTPAGELLVRFADGRPFHRLDLRCGNAAFEHRCGEDRYSGTLRVLDHDEWHQEWQVRGPETHLRIGSRFRRIAAGTS